MGVRRYLLILALLVAGATSLGAARAPEDRVLTLVGPEHVAIGRTAVFQLQAGGITSEQEALAVRVVLTLPDGLTYESGEPGAVGVSGGGSRNSGPCVADGPAVTCTVDHPEDADNGIVSWTATLRVAEDVTPGSPLTVTAAADGVTETFQTTGVRGADLAVAVAGAPTGVITPGEAWTYTVVVRNLGPDPVTRFTLTEWFDGGWYRGGTAEHEGATCTSDPGSFVCLVDLLVPPGGEIRIDHVMPTLANDRTYGRRGIVELEVTDQPSPLDPANDKVTFPVRFAAKPKPAPSHSPSASPSTAAPAPGAGGGGLPITGPAAAPLTLAGVALLLAGVAALRLSRRRPGLG